MLYIGNNKIIKGYIGNTPIAYAGFGKSELIKIGLKKGTIVPVCTNYSVTPGSIITVEYTLEGLTENQITVTYDNTFFIKDGNNYTLIDEGYSEIIYNVDGVPHATIRVATMETINNSHILNYEPSVPNLPSYITASYGKFSRKSGYNGTSYVNRLWSTDTTSGYLKLDMSDLTGAFSITVTYDSNSNVSNNQFRIYLSTSENANTNVLETLASGWGKNKDAIVKSATYSEAGIYYLHFSATEGYNTSSPILGIKSFEIISEENIYPATQLLIEPDSIQNKIGESFSLDLTLIPSNANEKIEISYDSEYLSEVNGVYTSLKSGPTSITYEGLYISGSVNVDIEE